MPEAVIYNQELMPAYRPFAASNSRVIKQPCWRAKVALGQDKQKANVI